MTKEHNLEFSFEEMVEGAREPSRTVPVAPYEDPREDTSHMRGRLNTPRAVKDFATAGRATMTIRSIKSGTRFTYKIHRPPDHKENKPPIWFVMVMIGPDNERSYTYLGNIRHDMTYDHGRKSKIFSNAPSAVAFAWTWNHVIRPENAYLMMAQLEIWHEGRCGQCGRKLTVPSSIDSGFGPDCLADREGRRK